MRNPYVRFNDEVFKNELLRKNEAYFKRMELE